MSPQRYPSSAWVDTLLRCGLRNGRVHGFQRPLPGLPNVRCGSRVCENSSASCFRGSSHPSDDHDRRIQSDLRGRFSEGCLRMRVFTRPRSIANRRRHEVRPFGCSSPRTAGSDPATAASTELCISWTEFSGTAAYKVHRSLGQKIASGGCRSSASLRFYWAARRPISSSCRLNNRWMGASHSARRPKPTAPDPG